MEIKFNKTQEEGKELVVKLSYTEFVNLKYALKDFVWMLDQCVAEKTRNGLWIEHHFVTKEMEKDVRILNEKFHVEI